jgi:hypothetical protein
MSDNIPARLLNVDDIPTMLQSLRYGLEDQSFEVAAGLTAGAGFTLTLPAHRGQ